MQTSRNIETTSSSISNPGKHQKRYFLLILVNVALVFSLPIQCGEKEFIKIGIMGPLTPSSKSIGIGHLQGITLAAKEFNEQNPDIQINLIVVDDFADPNEGLRKFQELSATDVLAIFGPCNSSVAKAIIVSGSLAKFKIPLISSLTTATELPALDKSGYYFRCNVSDKKRLSGLLERIFSPKVETRNLIVIYEGHGDPYGTGLKNDTEACVNERNKVGTGKPAFYFDYERDLNENAAKELVQKIGSTNSFNHHDAILLLGLETDALQICKAIRKAKIESTIYLPEPVHTIFTSVSKEELDISNIRVFSLYSTENSSIPNSDFREHFNRAFNELPTFPSELSYDAAQIFFSAIKTAKRKNKAIALFRDELKQILESNSFASAQFLLNSSHKFENHEYTNIVFQGMKFDYDKRLVPWDEVINARVPVIDGKPLFTPQLFHLIIVLFCGWIGSVAGTYNRFRKWELFSIENCVIDPFIAFVVFHLFFLFVFITKHDLLESQQDATLVYQYGGIVVGLISGFFGVMSLLFALNKVGIKIDIPAAPSSTTQVPLTTQTPITASDPTPNSGTE